MKFVVAMLVIVLSSVPIPAQVTKEKGTYILNDVWGGNLSGVQSCFKRDERTGVLTASECYGKPVPFSVMLYELNEDLLPVSHFDLNLCNLKDKRGKFYGLPEHRRYKSCDLSNVVLAYGGWCEAGFRDAIGGVHFSQALMPLIEVIEYEHSIVIYVKSYLKSFRITDDADEAAAVAFFETIPPIEAMDIRGEGLDIFPKDYMGWLPLKRGMR